MYEKELRNNVILYLPKIIHTLVCIWNYGTLIDNTSHKIQQHSNTAFTYLTISGKSFFQMIIKDHMACFLNGENSRGCCEERA